MTNEQNFIFKKKGIFLKHIGRVIQTGYKSRVPGSIRSNQFVFSVVNEKVVYHLMTSRGAFMELHYK